MAYEDKTERSLPTLLSDLSRETIELVRQEIALGRAEISEKISTAERGLVSVAIGAAILLAGIFILLQAVVNGLAMVLPPDLAPWLAPLIVGWNWTLLGSTKAGVAAIAVIGYIMVKSGSSRLQPDNLMPQRTMDSLRRDKAVAQEKVR